MPAKTRVLMLGGTGIISTDCTLLALQRPDIDLALLNRGRNPSFLPPETTVLQADIGDADAVRAQLGDRTFDVVCDFISYTPSSLRHKLDLFHGRCGQYVFISSCAAYRPDPFVLLKTEANSVPGNTLWEYGMNKVLCERLLQEESARTGMAYTIVRPSYTYNHIRFFNPYAINHWESWTIARRMLDRKPVVLHDDGLQLCTATHTSDFAKAFVGLWGNPLAMNQDFHITSGEYLTWKKIAAIQAEILGVPLAVVCVPAHDLYYETLPWNPAAAQKIMHTTTHDCYDSAKVAAAVPEFVCTTPFRQGIEKTIDFYLRCPDFQKVNPQWDAFFDRICQQYPGR